eukprot:scaffold15497_cov117-Cylindrotheca_fusiformis.AAC.2
MANTTDDSILCEIVGAQKLTINNASGLLLDPIKEEKLHTYCLVRNDTGKIVHTTKVVSGKNPIWTATSKSLFLLTESRIGRSLSSKLTVEVYALKTYNNNNSMMMLHKIGGGDGFNPEPSNQILLGSIQLEKSAILSRCNGERMELPLLLPQSSNSCSSDSETTTNSGGSLAIRFRMANPSDARILELLEQPTEKKFLLQEIIHIDQPLAKLVTETSESKIVRSGLCSMVNHIFTASTVYDTTSYRELKRVKPHPDPQQPEMTEFLPGIEIRKRTYEPSQSWVKAGSGQLGRLFVEVLACHNLPNMDLGEAVGDYTDPFVCLVYEDTVAMTDVIDDELSPHWLPWTQRAFSFGMMHPASTLYIGVFDFDLGQGNDHDPIGRVAVNLSNLHHDMEYTLQYNLYPSANVTDRTANGSITLRLRMECYNEKAALLSAVLSPRPKINVNVRKKKTFRVVRYTCFGEYDNEESFDFTVTRSYINEILEYKQQLSYVIQDSLLSLMFWRGQVDLLGDEKNKVPLYSFLFFVSACHLIEKPHLIIPFTLLSISLMMMANFTVRSEHPSPWHRCRSIREQVDILTNNHWKNNSLPPEEEKIRPQGIRAYEGEKEAQAYEKAIRDRQEQDLVRAEKLAELQEELNSYGDDNIATEVNKGGLIIPADLHARLSGWQGILGGICRFFRFIRLVALWEESILSFWVTVAFFASGVLTMMLPWRFILLWTGRCIVWGMFGPHMKLVDFFMIPEEGKEKVLIKNADRLFQEARLRREEAVKVQDIKALAFGKYSVQVPSFNVARHFDRPLAHSFAKPCLERPAVQVARMIPGQQFYGTMIPRPEEGVVLEGDETLPPMHHSPLMEGDGTSTENEAKTNVETEDTSQTIATVTIGSTNLERRTSMMDMGMEVMPKNVDFLEGEGMEIVATGST